MAEVVKLKILMWGDCPGSFRWAQRHHKDPSKKKTGGSESVVGDMLTEARDQNDARKWPQAKACKAPLEAEKKPENRLFLRSLQKEPATPTP